MTGQTPDAASSQEILIQEYKAEIARLRKAYERLRGENRLLREYVSATSAGRSWIERVLS